MTPNDVLSMAHRTIAERLPGIDTILFDLDGTLYLGPREIPGAARTVARLQAAGKQVFFLSNNSSKSHAQYVQRLTALGIAATEHAIVLSTDALIAHLRARQVRDVHLLGTHGLRETLEAAGIRTDAMRPACVVIGYDTELTYDKLHRACRFINAGVEMIATHCDAFCPSEDGPLPDVGSFLEMLRVATGHVPSHILGKPTPSMLTAIRARAAVDPARTLVVGDRLYTDMQFARNIGAQGVLVLSGDTTPEQLQASVLKPDFVLDSVAQML